MSGSSDDDEPLGRGQSEGLSLLESAPSVLKGGLMSQKQTNSVAFALLAMNIFLLFLAISVRWEAETWVLNMDMIGANFVGLLCGFIAGIWVAGQAGEKKLIDEREKWVDKNNRLHKEISEGKAKD